MSGVVLSTLTLLLTTLLLLGTLPAATSDNDFLVKLLVTVDAKGVEKWKSFSGKTTTEDLKKEMRAYVVEVNEAYKSLGKVETTMSIQFEEPEIVVLNRNILAVRGGIATAYRAKYNYQQWAKNQGKQFDIAVLFTGYELASRGDTGTVGHANKGAVCKDNGVVIVELSGRYIDPLIMAHEIGHTLDADHDGFEASSSCPASDYYVMTPGLVISSPNKYFFSKCSYKTFYKFLVTEERGKECLTDGKKENIVKGPRIGELVSADSQCKRRYERSPGVDRKWYAKRGYDVNICQQIRCDAYINDPSDSSLPWVATHQGMSCGKGKRCNQGVCTTASDGDVSVSHTCPFGDQIGNIFKDRKCSSLKYDECYNFQTECCQTCARFKDTPADKACRDLQGPASSLVRNKYKYWRDELCQTLYCVTSFNQEFQYQKHDTPEGLDCGQYKKCKNKKCVKVDSGGNPDMPDMCPYGDQPWIPSYHRTCPQQVEYYGCSEHRWAPVCCDTCAGVLKRVLGSG